MKERAALGFGNNIDYEIVWDSRVIEDLIVQYEIYSDELDVNRDITHERNLVISILSFLKAGIGGERFVASSAIIERFSQRFQKKVTLGGTSVRAAIALWKLGHTSALHLVTINDQVRNLIPPKNPYVCSNSEDSSYPHLIVQFGKGTCIRAGDIDICVEHANRIIYHSDDDNIAMKLDERFSSLITEAQVLLVSGFNAMRSEVSLTNRLATLVRIIGSLPEDALVYYEDAGYSVPRLSQLVYRNLAKHLDIVGLNEDELQGYLNRKLDLLDVFEIKQALVELHRQIPVPVIVVHSRYWALAFGEGMTSRVAEGLKMGVTIATTRFCYGDDFTVENYKEIESLPPGNENARFADAMNMLPGDELYCVPVAHIEQSSVTTVGLGDTFVGGFLAALLH